MKILLSGILLIIIIVVFSANKYVFAGNSSTAQTDSTCLAKDSTLTKDSIKTKEKSPVNIYEDGIGPIKEVKLEEKIDESLVSKGNSLYYSKCFACHQLDNRVVGPPLRNITKEVSPVYFMNYLLNTTEMQKKVPRVIKLIKEYNGELMPNQSLSEKQARALLEYFRSVAKKK
ncbi:cytochrome c [bacterium BMS3Abin03]|nr:cytochrome c [bacterium BMS3Abin03]